jgi:hypothetical protein
MKIFIHKLSEQRCPPGLAGNTPMYPCPDTTGGSLIALASSRGRWVQLGDNNEAGTM